MSEGPIKAERDAWKPPRVSTTNRERVCLQHLGASLAYCGRRLYASTTNLAGVTCADCLAAWRADHPEEMLS